MSRITWQISSGYVSQLLVVGMSVGFIPFFVDILGIRAYGLIGIYIAAQATFSILDIGFTNGLMREMSRLYILRQDHQIKSTIATFEWLGGTLCLLAVVVGAIFYAFNSEHIIQLFQGKTSDAALVFCAAIGLICLRVYENIYRQTLIGLERVTLVNAFVAVSATFKGIGTFLVLKFLSPTLQGYFLANIVASVFTVVMLVVAIKRNSIIAAVDHVPAEPSFEILSKVFNFSFGIVIVMALTTLLQQTDRIILPLKISLEDFGYYSFSASIAAGIFYLVVPITSSVYPRLCQLAQTGKSQQALQLFSNASQFVSCLLTPIVVLTAAQSRQIIYLWSNSEALAANTSEIFSILLLGNFFLALAYLPSQFQFAFGRVKHWIYLLMIIGISYGSSVWFLAYQIQGLGVASLWCLVNAALLFIATPFTLTRLHLLSVSEWLAEDLLRPLLLITLSMAFMLSLIHNLSSYQSDTFFVFSSLFVLLLGYLVGAFLAVPKVGHQFMKIVEARFKP